ncbi:MAG: hypothetical protein HY960_10975 [Ignavibacteriae bacterium]|nr:hypothetical protein [Ignavibacteriota bacterium]
MKAAVDSILDLSTWELPNPKNPETAYFPAKDGVGRQMARWILPDSLSPLDLFCYIRARFGPPNGPTMLIRQNSTDNLIQWHYTLRTGTIPIDIVGLTSRIEVSFTHVPEFSRADQEKLVENIKKDISHRAPEIKAVRQQLEKYSLFINPYKRLSDILDDLQNRLQGLKLDEIQLPRTPTTAVTKKEAEEWQAEAKRCQVVFREGALLGTSIRMIAPVLGESFVNLLIFSLAKPEIKNDERLYKDLINKQIDIRIKSLHLYCQGFAKPIDASSDSFKDFHTLMNRRNDILHGNIDPLRLKYDEAYFYGTIPLFTTQKDFATRGIKEYLSGVEPEIALADIRTVTRFVEFVLNHLSPDYISSVEMIMNDPKPGWREDTKRIGILFSGVAEMLLIKE